MTNNVQIELVLRQINSSSGVIGKLLLMEPDGRNRFGLIFETPEGTHQGAIYRVETAWDDESKMIRSNKADIDDNDPDLIGAPIYRWADLGNNFWMERF